MKPRSSLLLHALSAATLLAAFPAAAKQTAKKPTDEARALARETADLRRQVKLANGKRFYILLNPETKQLAFMYQGNPLYELTAEKIEVGARRGILGGGTLPHGWQDSVWTEGVLEPARVGRFVELDVTAEDYEERREATLIPPTPEEAYPAPPRWGIRYREGLKLEFTSEGSKRPQGPGFLRRIGTWFRNLFRPSETVRVRVQLKGSDADFFYRAMPSTTGFALTRRP